MVQQTSKVQKSITKKKGKTSLHANSRDAQRLRRAISRDERVLKTIASRANQNAPLLSRVQFFQNEVADAHDAFDVAAVQRITLSFIERNDQVMKEMHAKRRPGRPPAAVEVSLQRVKESEESEYLSGFWIPDILNTYVHAPPQGFMPMQTAKFLIRQNLKSLEEWSGEWPGLHSVQFIRIYKDGTVRPSTFPPRKS